MAPQLAQHHGPSPLPVQEEPNDINRSWTHTKAADFHAADWEWTARDAAGWQGARLSLDGRGWRLGDRR